LNERRRSSWPLEPVHATNVPNCAPQRIGLATDTRISLQAYALRAAQLPPPADDSGDRRADPAIDTQAATQEIHTCPHHHCHRRSRPAGTTTRPLPLTASRRPRLRRCQGLRTRRQRGARARRRVRRVRRRTLHRHHGALGLGQIDAHAQCRRARPPHVRHGAHRDTTSPSWTTANFTSCAATASGSSSRPFTWCRRSRPPRTSRSPPSRRRTPDPDCSTMCADGRTEEPPETPTVGALGRAAATGGRRSRARLAARRSSSPMSPPQPRLPVPVPRFLSFMRAAVREYRPDHRDGHPRPVAASYATGPCSSPDGRSSTDIDRPTADSVIDRIRHLGA